MVADVKPRTPQARRDRRRMRTQRAFGEAAIRLFTDHGFASTTVEDIAEAADYSVSSFFRLFAKKEDVVFFDVPDKLEDLRRAVEAEDPSAAAPTIAETLLQNAREWDAEEGSITLARFRLFHQEPALRSRYLEYCGEWEDVLTELFLREGRGRSADEIAARMRAAAIVSAFRVAMNTFMAYGGSLVAHLSSAYRCLEAPLLTSGAVTSDAVTVRRNRVAVSKTTSR